MIPRSTSYLLLLLAVACSSPSSSTLSLPKGKDPRISLAVPTPPGAPLSALHLARWVGSQNAKPAPTAPTSQTPHPSFTLLTHRFDVDVDGAHNAYGPPGSHTLDDLRNAHYRGRKHAEIVGYLTDDDDPNLPILQGPLDPYPGFYISQTAFTDPAIQNPRNPRRYVDATRINYVVLGSAARRRGVQLGDFAAVYSRRTHRSVFAIVADDGNPSGDEGSLHLLQALGYPFRNGIDDAIETRDILIRFYPHSNPTHLFPRTQSALDAAAIKLGLSRDFTATK